MKLISRFALALAAVALLASCAAATDTANKVTNNLTGSAKKLMVDLPKSLTTKAAASGSVSRAPVSAQAAPASQGYSMIQSTVTSAKMFMPFMAQYSTMIDAVVSQNSLSPSSATVTGKTLTITQAMVDDMKASVDADMLDTTMMPKAGDSMTMPGFVYNTSSNSNFNYSFAMADTASGMTMTFYWNTDKSKFGMEMTMTSIGMTMTVANDTATASTVMKIASTGSVFTMKFKADSAAAATQGVYVGMNVDMTGGTPMTISGWADDNGGAVSFANFGSTFTEEFTGAGAMSYQGYDAGAGAGVVVLYGTAATAAYTAKLVNADWGNAPTFFL